MTLSLFVFKEHPDLIKSFLHPIPFESSSRGPSEGLQAGFLTARWGIGRTLASGGNLFQFGTSTSCSQRIQTVQNVSKNKDDTNCWMWRLWFYSRNKALTAVTMLLGG